MSKTTLMGGEGQPSSLTSGKKEDHVSLKGERFNYGVDRGKKKKKEKSGHLTFVEDFTQSQERVCPSRALLSQEGKGGGTPFSKTEQWGHQLKQGLKLFSLGEREDSRAKGLVLQPDPRRRRRQRLFEKESSSGKGEFAPKKTLLKKRD